MLLLKRKRKTETGVFHPNLKQGVGAPYPPPTLVALYDISSFCKVNGSFMSIFLPLHCCYLQLIVLLQMIHTYANLSGFF